MHLLRSYFKTGERDCTGYSPKRYRVQSIAFTLLFTVLITSCEKKPEVPQGPLQIYFTADVNGRLEPCGCFTGQYGGLTRIDTWLDYRDPTAASLRLDVGDALKGTADYDLIHYEHLAKGFQHLNYQALNVGAREASLSLAELKEIAAKTGAPLISANLVDDQTGTPVLPPYRMVESQNRKVAVIGLVDPASVTNTLGEGLAVQAMETSLTNLLSKIATEHSPDLTILLAFTDEAKLRSLAQQFYELDIILGGDVPQPSQELIIENESVILFTTNEARAVGDLKFELTGRQITKPAFDIHLMQETIPQSPAILALSKSYRDLVRTTKLDIDDPASADNEAIIPGGGFGHSYVGSESCAACHPKATAAWKKSRHAHAFSTLTKSSTDADPNCIVCHTVGFGEVSGYRREFGADKLTNVGCESCHGPGSEHVTQRALGDPTKVTFQFRPLGASDCTKCHHGEFSRPFKWDEFWPLIQHGKEAAMP
ncbi:MAG: multiheme c-type cytochrome [Verrucomicrobiales bacterium]|nr:multiheme c-type cytochrome [Verrucomicrobiales bacterium]